MDYTTVEEILRVIMQIEWDSEMVDRNYLPFTATDDEERQCIEWMEELDDLANKLTEFGIKHAGGEENWKEASLKVRGY